MTRYVGITNQGVAAATALLGACLAGMLALLGVDTLSETRVLAMILFSAALPLLSYSISVEILNKSKRSTSIYNILIIITGAGCGILGLFFAIYHLSAIAAAVFASCCLLTLTLSWFVSKN